MNTCFRRKKKRNTQVLAKNSKVYFQVQSSMLRRALTKQSQLDSKESFFNYLDLFYWVVLTAGKTFLFSLHETTYSKEMELVLFLRKMKTWLLAWSKNIYQNLSKNKKKQRRRQTNERKVSRSRKKLKKMFKQELLNNISSSCLTLLIKSSLILWNLSHLSIQTNLSKHAY